MLEGDDLPLLHAVNPIRNFMEKKLLALDLQGVADRPAETLNFSVGDPTFYNFKPNPHILESVAAGISGHHDYTDVQGDPGCRQFLAKLYSNSRFQLTKEDVTLTSGGSMTLILSLLTLTDPGDNILVPEPGFPLIRAVAAAFGTELRGYRLQEPDYEVTAGALEGLVDGRTRFLLVNDPSNPLGSVMAVESKLAVLAFCERHGLPIVADEIYEDMVFRGEWRSFAELTTSVPVVRCTGLTKKYCVPGWRFGFMMLYGPAGAFEEVRRGLRNWCSIFLAPNSLVQRRLEQVIAEPTEPARLRDMMGQIGRYIQRMAAGLERIKGIRCGKSFGAMYLTFSCELALYDFKDIEELALLLFREENVMLFPGSLFESQASNFCRMVVCTCPEDVFRRFNRFFERHARK